MGSYTTSNRLAWLTWSLAREVILWKWTVSVPFERRPDVVLFAQFVNGNNNWKIKHDDDHDHHFLTNKKKQLHFVEPNESKLIFLLTVFFARFCKLGSILELCHSWCPFSWYLYVYIYIYICIYIHTLCISKRNSQFLPGNQRVWASPSFGTIWRWSAWKMALDRWQKMFFW